MRARTVIESDELSNKALIVITHLPYGVLVSTVVERIADLARDRVLDSISDLRNESPGDEMRIVIVCKRDIPAQRFLDQLYERTAMQTTIDVNMTALVPQPETGLLVPSLLTLKELLERFIAHRDAVIARRIDSRPTRMRLIKDDLRRIADAYGDARRTTIG